MTDFRGANMQAVEAQDRLAAKNAELASLRERVKELEAEADKYCAWWREVRDEAIRLQQERDEAVERLRPFAEGSLDMAGVAIIIGSPWAEPALKYARNFIRQLAAGKEKGDGE